MKTHRVLLAALLLVAPATQAALTFTFNRISNTEATLTATGLVGLGFPTGENIGNFSNLELLGVMDNAEFGPAIGSVSQTIGLQFAGEELQGWTVLEGDMIPTPNFVFGDLDSPTGSSAGTASGNIAWLPVGSTGPAFATYDGQNATTFPLNGTYQVGTWEIVPEPSSAILVLAAGALGFVRRRRDLV